MNKLILFCIICVAEGYVNEGRESISITRHHKGDIFIASGAKCYKELCSGLSGGTGTTNGNSDCECKCKQNRPVFRDDLNICVDDIKECNLVPFSSSSAVKKIPYVFLPLKGQIVYPSAEIIISDVGAPVCVVSGGQFLSREGWLNLRNNSVVEPPFRLFRDEGRTYLQWLGESSLRMAMEGRIILVNLMCKEASFTEEPKIFTPCIAFRVAGNPAIREVVFGSDVHLKEEYSGGLSIREYVAIGICSLLLAVVYVASVFLYLQWRRRRRKEKKKCGEDAQLTLGEEGVIKSNPLLQASRHLNGGGQDNAGYITDSNSCCSDGDQSDLLCLEDDDLEIHQNVQTSAIVHPCTNDYGDTILGQDANSIEKLPEENVSIVETLEAKEDHLDSVKAMGCVNGRRKLYFNPSYFEPDLLKAPPPAALEFLIKIREVIAIAKHKMSSKKFSPSLLGIPEEEGSQKTTESSSIRTSKMDKTKNNETKNTLTADNFHLISDAFCCPMDTKQRIIRKWLEDVPVMSLNKEQKSNESPKQKPKLEDIKILNKSKLWQINENRTPVAAKEVKIPVPPTRLEKKKPSTKGKAPPLPPQAKVNAKEQPKTEKKDSPTFTFSSNKKTSSSPPPPPRPPPMPSFPKEVEAPIVQGKDRVPPVVAKNLMDAVIQELAGFKRKDKLKGATTLEKEESSRREDTLRETATKTKEEENTIDSIISPVQETVESKIQPLSNNLVAEVSKPLIQNHINTKPIQNVSQDDHEYEVILLNTDPKPSEQKTKDLKIYNLPEIFSKSEKNEGYSLVSEVYVNDGYSCCSGESPPSSYSSKTSGKIMYEPVNGKPGRLTIHVNDNPEQYHDTKWESDNFEPDTLDRKPRKKSKALRNTKDINEENERYSNQKFHDMKCYINSNNSTNENYTDSLERPSIMLKTNGSFKRNSIERNIDDLLRNFNWNRVENFGSLREIYEAKNKNHRRKAETTSLIDTANCDNDRISTLSWSEERRNKLLHRGIVLHIADSDTRRHKTQKTSTKTLNTADKVPSRPPKPCPSPRSRSQSPRATNTPPSPSKLTRGFPSQQISLQPSVSPRNKSPPLPPPRSLPVPIPTCPKTFTNSSFRKDKPSSPSFHLANSVFNAPKPPRTPPICISPTSFSSQPSSLPPRLSPSIDDSPPLPPRNSKPPRPPKNVTKPRQRIPPNKFASRPLPPLPQPRPSKECSPSPTISYKDPETLSTLSGASMDSLNSSEYEAFYTLPYEEEETENSNQDNYRVPRNPRPVKADRFRLNNVTVISSPSESNFETVGKSIAENYFRNQRHLGTNKVSSNRVEDSGYLSTDSNDSCYPPQMSRIGEKMESCGSQNSETEESFGDGASESGAESTTTDSFFYGDFKTKKTADDGVTFSSFSLRLSDVEVNSDTERHCVPITVRP